ncbi:MAG: TatD family hydrolase [Lachnospirales bacterium]
MIFESHAHYQDERFDDDREELIQKIFDSGVDVVVDITSYEKEFDYVMELCEKYDKFYCTLGVHPHEAKDITDNTLNRIRELSKNKKVVAVGEIGLDYYYDLSDRETQKKWFIKQLNLAKALDLPVVIHSRDACLDTLNILKEYGHGRGVVHCFSGSYETAVEYIKLGYKIGVGGVLTFKNAKLPDISKKVGLEHIVIETDAPYLTPVPNRGKRNDSTNLKYVVEALANIFEVSEKEVEDITYKNAMEMYEIN